MTDRDRFERGRDRGFGQGQERPWDRQRFQSESGGYPGDEDRDRYSRLGGAGEEYERYSQGGRQGYQGYQGGGYPAGEYPAGGSGGGQQYGQRDWGHPRGGYGSGPYESGMRDGQYRPSQRGRFAGKGPKGYKRSDERIREDVCDALMMDPELDASEIEVEVSEGEIMLAGTVSHREDKWRAEQLAESVPGVHDVSNALRVKRGDSSEQRPQAGDTTQRDAARGGAQSGGGNISQGGAGNGSRA